jgi:SWI/SNF-related matrix-associated actin-dependent regulator of chromatin subfamily A3
MAAILAPLLDRRQILAEGTVTGNRNAYNIPISIELLVARESVDTVTAQLMSRFVLSDTMVTPGSRPRPRPPPPKVPQYTSVSTAGGVGAVEYDNLVRNSIQIDPRTIREAPEKFGMSVQDLEKLPVAKQPKQIRTPMLNYQLQGLQWLLEMEHPKLPQGEEVKQFWTNKGGNWFNIATY